jgi:hypothetical protein
MTTDEDRARVKNFIKEHPEEAKRLQDEIAMETQVEQLKKVIEEAQTTIKSQAISFGKRIAKLEKEVDENREKLKLEKKYVKKHKDKEESSKEIPEEPVYVPILPMVLKTHPGKAKEIPEEPVYIPDTSKAPKSVESLLPVPTPPPAAPKQTPKPAEKAPEKKGNTLSKRAKEIEKKVIENKDQKKVTMLKIIWRHQNADPNIKCCDLGILYEEAAQAGVPKTELESLLEELITEGRASEEHTGSLKALVEPSDKGFFET